MNFRTLGRSGLAISEIGYGAWGLGGIQWTDGSDTESLQALTCAFELGVNFVDTALAYGDGHSEQVVGRAIKAWGGPVLIGTKIPPKNRVWPAASNAALEQVFPSDYMIECTEQSLRNLGVERLDLQQLHVWSPAWTEQEGWRRAFAALKQSGKVRFMGVSLTEHEADSGLGLVRTGLVDSLQVLYNIFDPSAAEHLFPAAHQFGVGIVARVPLDEGGLTGNIRDDTTFAPGDFRATYFRGNRKHELVRRLQKLQEDLGVSSGALSEIAIRFCLSNPAVSAVIPGMRRINHVKSNVGAALKGPLTPNVLSVASRHRWRRNFYT